MSFKYSIMRIFGNAGMYFVSPYTGSAIVGAPNLEIALWTMTIGIILSASREVLDAAKQKT